MKNILRFVFIASLFLFVSVTQVFAEEMIPESKNEVVFIADTSIREAKVVSQIENKIEISFGIKNGEGVQTGVKYGISLIKETNKGQFLMDEYISPEVLSLSENTLAKKNVQYIAPENISGDYTILITLKKESGLVLGLGVAGKVNLTSSVKGIQILPETCNLTIFGNDNKNKYTLNQGVDINKDESLKLNCRAKNTVEESIQATPSFVTHYRNTYGDIVSGIDGDTTPIKFASLEEKDISFVLPKPTDPQAYDVITTLKYGENTSNKITAHYVLQGISATIQNLSLSKDYYDKGEEALLSFYWTPSADGFPGSRGGDSTVSAGLNLSASIKNGNGRKCASPINQNLDTTKSLVEIPVSITSNCVDPQVLLSIKDGNGQILAEKTFNIKTTTKPEKSNNTNIIILIVIIVVILVAVILFYLKKKKSNSNIPMGVLLLVFTLVSLGSLIPLKKINAVNFNLDGPDGSQLSVALDLNKVIFSPEETMNVTANAVYLTCSNTSVDVEIDGFLVSYYTVFPILDAKEALGGASFFGSGSAKVQKTPGDYLLRISSTVKISAYMAAVNNVGGEVITAFTLMDLIDKGIASGYTYSASGGIYGTLTSNSGEVLIIGSGAKSGLELEYVTFDIPYKVVAPKTLNVDVYKQSNPSIPIPKNAQGITTEPIASKTPIILKWESFGFNNNIICTLPSGNEESAGTDYGSIYYDIGPDDTTTYSVTCNDDVVTAPVPNPTKTLPNTCGTVGVTGECRDYTTGDPTVFCSEARFSNETSCNLQARCRWLYCAL